jgi:hypothetical protein
MNRHFSCWSLGWALLLVVSADATHATAQDATVLQARRDARYILDNAGRANDEMLNHARDMLRLTEHRPWTYTDDAGRERTYHGGFGGVVEQADTAVLRFTTGQTVPIENLSAEDRHIINVTLELMVLVGEDRKLIENPRFLGGFNPTDVQFVRVLIPTPVYVDQGDRRAAVQLQAGQVLPVSGESDQYFRVTLDNGSQARIARQVVEEFVPPGGPGPIAVGQPGVDFPKIDAQLSFDPIRRTPPRFEVVPLGGAAWQAGVRQGDWLLSVNGEEVGSEVEYLMAAGIDNGRLRLIVENSFTGRSFVADFGSVRRR